MALDNGFFFLSTGGNYGINKKTKYLFTCFCFCFFDRFYYVSKTIFYSSSSRLKYA